MPEVPKIVYSRLRAGAADAHPDPNLLTAFAEQALSPAEREGVLQHLAQCGDCREVIAIALPPSESALVAHAASESEESSVAPVYAEKARGKWFGWLGLRGLAFAAGIVIVASVLMLRPGKSPAPQTETTTASVKTDASPALVQTPEIATRTAAPQSPAAEQRLTASLKKDELPSRGQNLRQDKLERQYSSRDLQVTPRAEPAELAKLQPGAVLQDNKRADLDAAPSRAVSAPASAGVVGGMVSETVAAAPAVSERKDQPSSAESDLSLMARNEAAAPIQKAKAALKEETPTAIGGLRKKQPSGASSNYAAAYQNSVNGAAAAWRLSNGVLQHSLDAGFSWQTVLRADHSLLCQATRDSDIWAGGQAGTVFHSSDAGATWTELHPAVNDQHLTADVTAITLEKPGETVLTTNTGESWTTMDNGKTWAVAGTIKK